MNVWIDILHTPQYNFYRNFILKLLSEGHFVYITVLKRGKTPKIVQTELGMHDNLSIDIVGNHSMNKKSAILDANIKRLRLLLKWKRGKKIDIAFSNGYLCSLVCKLHHIPSYTFDDDPQTFDYKLKLWFSNKSHYCLYQLPKDYKISPKVSILKALKEWSYLAPNVYEPHVEALEEYGVNPKEYVFLREVSVGTINYTGQATGAILNIQNMIPKDKKVLFSLEDKSKRDLYPKDWILLQEPLKDIHSLIYYAAGLVSSGDSMAREAALLGIPAYYLGIRHSMPANLAAAAVADFNNEVSLPFEDWVKKISQEPSYLNEQQEKTRTEIKNHFVDLNSYMYSLLNVAKTK